MTEPRHPALDWSLSDETKAHLAALAEQAARPMPNFVCGPVPNDVLHLEIEPCPFCAVPPAVNDTLEGICIECVNPQCPTICKTYGASREVAKQRWNIRVYPRYITTD
jgi:hypothetical protein